MVADIRDIGVEGLPMYGNLILSSDDDGYFIYLFGSGCTSSGYIFIVN